VSAAHDSSAAYNRLAIAKSAAYGRLAIARSAACGPAADGNLAVVLVNLWVVSFGSESGLEIVIWKCFITINVFY